MNTVCIAHGNCDYGPGMKLTELQGHLARLGGGRVRHLRIRQEQKLQHQATGSEESYAPRILNVGSLNLCKHLVTLEILGMSAEVQGLNKIPTLRHLHLSWDDRSTNMSLQDLSQLTNHALLETLTLANCHQGEFTRSYKLLVGPPVRDSFNCILSVLKLGTLLC